MPPFGGVMRRLLVFTVALVLAAGTILKGKQPEVVSTQTNIAEQVMNLAVEIHAIKDGNIGVGSGVLYRANGELYVLTAAHVVEEGAMCLIDQKSIDDDSVCKMWQGEVVARDNDSDWAIIRLVGESQGIRVGTTFMPSPLRVGNEVYVVGSPLGEENTITEGIVANHKRSVSWNNDRHTVITCNGAPGSSGGGVYDAKTGKCIGIVVRLNRGANLLYVVSIETILKDLEEMGKSSLLPS